MTISVLGIDIAKNTFQLHGTDCAGNAVLKQRLPRNKLAAYVANLPQCLVVMESCGGANYWARVFQRNMTLTPISKYDSDTYFFSAYVANLPQCLEKYDSDTYF